MTGQTFGAWTVIERAPLRAELVNKNARWLCRCACGTEKVLQGAALRTGLTDRCRECANKGLQTHGLSTSPVYNIWTGIKQRTGNPSCSVWHLYGGRGITMAAEWRDSFERFAADMGPRPSPAHSVDRIDNDGPYAPWNCRWATKTEQSRNSRHNVHWTHDGRTLTIVEWAEELGADPNTLRQRVVAYGWPVERALSTPIRPRGRNFRHQEGGSDWSHQQADGRATCLDRGTGHTEPSAERA